MENDINPQQKQLILTILLQENSKQYILSKEQADNLLEILETHYSKKHKDEESEKVKDELIKLIQSSEIISIYRNGDKIEICLQPTKAVFM